MQQSKACYRNLHQLVLIILSLSYNQQENNQQENT